MPAEKVTARAIAAEAGANLASITYHFGSKDELVTAAVVEGLDRWLVEIADRLGDLAALPPAQRFRRAADAVAATRRDHAGLARNLVGAFARAPYDEKVRALLTAGFRRSRGEVAALLGLLGDGTDEAGDDAGGLVLALFNGLLFQALLDPGLAIEGARFGRAAARLRTALPG